MRNELVLGLLGSALYLAAGIAVMVGAWRACAWWIAPFRAKPQPRRVIARGWRGWQWDGEDFDAIDWGASRGAS